LNLIQAAEALARGTSTSRDLVEGCLARIVDPTGEGARVFIQIYASHARASADAMDQLRRVGRAPGRFAGIPISIKDLFDVAGEVTRAGSVVLADAPPARAHAVVVARLLSAGLIPVGRTNMTEFAFSGVGINPHYGTPRSPWDRATGRISGGSSSGAAVSVSDGFAFAGIGTDTGGSCRIPAALCGIVGFKPTARRVPLDGALPLSPSLDSIGPLAQSVACCAALDGIMSGASDAPLVPVAPAGLRFVLPMNFAFAHLDAATEAAFDRAVSCLDAAGVIVDRRDVQAFDRIDDAHRKGGFAATEAYAWHRALLETSGNRYDPRVANRIAPGGDMSAADYFELTEARARIGQLFAAEMAGYDGLIMPTVPIMPPAIAEFANDNDYKRLNFLLLRMPSAINFLDGCAISLPCNAAGRPPAGLTIAATHCQDARLLAIAAAIEPLIIPGAFDTDRY
jgi:aspartyl-tRNA(Asn)/glutamyl-tRNA(Gln) amidotransferase subunit A